MPHECTNCGRTFPDGSKEMLSGCPDCGGNKFQFAPNATVARESSERAGGSGTAERAQSAGRPYPDSGSEDSNGVATRAAETVRDLVSSDSPEDARPGTEGTDGTTDAERSWPTTDSGSPADGGTDSATDSNAGSSEVGEFSEWPDTARRPEDRSSAGGGDPESTVADPSRAVSSDATSDAPTPDRSTRTQTTNSSPADPSPAADPSPSVDPSLSADSISFADDEDTAQADARSEVVSRDDLPSEQVRSGDATTAGETDLPSQSADGDDAPPDHGRVVSEPSADRPSVEELREELNEQFESIKIVSPGQYELNLMELYNREEYIISLQEDGRYVIDVPDSWRGDDEG